MARRQRRFVALGTAVLLAAADAVADRTLSLMGDARSGAKVIKFDRASN